MKRALLIIQKKSRIYCISIIIKLGEFTSLKNIKNIQAKLRKDIRNENGTHFLFSNVRKPL